MRRIVTIAIALAAASCGSDKASQPAPAVAATGSFDHEVTVNAAEQGTAQPPVLHISSWRVPLVDPRGRPVILGKATAATITLHNAYDEPKDISQILCIDGAHAPPPTKNADGSATWTIAASDRDRPLEIEVGFGPNYPGYPDGPPVATLRYRVDIRPAE